MIDTGKEIIDIKKYRIHPEAKCFSDHYGSRIELISVSRSYWPAKWRLTHWELTFQYLFSYGAITKRYADAERLLNSTLDNLNHHQRVLGEGRPEWNIDDVPAFVAWHLKSAPHHNYTVGAAIMRKRL
jgi:hypothetical protein